MESILIYSGARNNIFFLPRPSCRNESREATRTLSLGDLSKFRSSIWMLSRREHDFAGNRSSRRGRAKKAKAAGDDENSRYALAGSRKRTGTTTTTTTTVQEEKRSRGRGTKRDETPVNTSGGLAPG